MLLAQTLLSTTISLLDTKKLKQSELSGLAYRDKRLYAISNKAELFIYKLKIKEKKIKRVKLLERLTLRDDRDKKVKKEHSDAEGLYFKKEQLLVSFERKNRVALYTTDAKKIKDIKINKKLRDDKKYIAKNRGLEAVAYSKKYGIVTAPERPLKKKKYHTIYAKKKRWKFEAEGSITALEFINKDELLVLLRGKSLLLLNLSSCENSSCKSQKVAKIEGNFEGLTRVRENLYLMVEDNDAKLQKSKLVLFELKS